MGISVNNILENQAYANQLEHLCQDSNYQEDMEVKSLTYNLRVEEADKADPTSYKYWKNREAAIFQILNGVASNNGEKFDFISLQECHNTWSGNPSWSKTLNEAIQPGGPLDGYGIIEAPGDTYHTDNIILYRKDRWTQEGTTTEITVPGSNDQNFVVGAKFTRNGEPGAKPFYVFGGHPPSGGDAPKDLDWLASAIASFEGANMQNPNWADDYQTFVMMDSNDKARTDGKNPNVPQGLPSYDGDDFITKDGFHDIYEELHPDEVNDNTKSTNRRWDDPIDPAHPGNREDLQFISGYDKTAENTSVRIDWKYNFNGQSYSPSDHAPVQNTTYFSTQSPPPSDYHAPTSIDDLKQQLQEFEDSSTDPNIQKVAQENLSAVKSLEDKGLSLTTIEAWLHSWLDELNGNPEFYTDLQKVDSSAKNTFFKLTGFSEFETKLSSHSFTKEEVTDIAKQFATGIFGLKDPNGLAFMQAFYSNLMDGQDLKTAAADAYTQVPSSQLSPEMNDFIQGLSGYSPSSTSISTDKNLFSSHVENPFGNSTYNFECELF